jgi:hypothetical protein
LTGAHSQYFFYSIGARRPHTPALAIGEPRFRHPGTPRRGNDRPSFGGSLTQVLRRFFPDRLRGYLFARPEALMVAWGVDSWARSDITVIECATRPDRTGPKASRPEK